MIGLAKELLAERVLRDRFFAPDFADGCAWWILLDLYRYPTQQISAVCYGSGHPYTTALRHLRALTEAGLVERNDHSSDGRQVLCSLSQAARDALTDYLSALSERRQQRIAA
jgi:DNA-binding MarR family transcriptional regulator